MKGISVVIASILMILITIGVIGFVYIFFSRITSTAGSAAQNQSEEQIAQFSKQILIDALNSTSVTIRNTGTSSIAPSEISVYADGSPRSCNPAISAIAPRSTQTCNFSPPCTTGQKIKVSSPTNSMEESC